MKTIDVKSVLIGALATMLATVSFGIGTAGAPSPAPRWEYGQFNRIRGLGDDGKQQHESWGTAQGSIDASSVAELNAKLGGDGKAEQLLPILNLLGKDGWEFVEQREISEGFTSSLFKRVAR